jgi:hypothetical protein
MLMQREKEGNDDSVQGRERDDFPPPFYFSIFSMVWKRQEMEEKKKFVDLILSLSRFVPLNNSIKWNRKKTESRKKNRKEKSRNEIGEKLEENRWKEIIS